MSSFALILHPPGIVATREDIRALLDPIAYLGSLGRRFWARQNLCVGALLQSVAPECAQERQPVLSGDGRYLIAADARLDDRLGLCRAILGEEADPLKKTDTELLLAAFIKWGRDCPKHLIGDFAFVVFDFQEQALFAAVDPLGVRRLFYAALPARRLIVGSDESFLLQIPELTGRWNELAVANWLLARPDREQSLFRDIQVLACGRQMHWVGGQRVVSRWWSPLPDHEIRYAQPQDYVEHLLELMRCAVADRMRSANGIVACELSGGMDSSSVSAFLQEQSGGVERVLAISQFFPGFPSCDESGFIREIAAYTGIESFTFDASEIIIAEFPLGYMPRAESSCAFDNPVQRRTLEIAAAQGADVLLTGDGGDAVLCGAPLSAYAERFLAGDLRVVLELARAAEKRGRSRSRWLFNGLARPLMRMLADRFLGPRRRLRKGLSLPDWLDVDLDLRRRIEEQTLAPDGPALRSDSHRTMWSFMTTAPTLMTLEAYRRNGQAMGIDVRAPFYDVRLVDFLFAIPPGLLHRHGFPKWLARNGMQGTLPESVLWRQDKTEFSEVYEAAWGRHSEQVTSILSGSPSVRRVPLVSPVNLVRHLRKKNVRMRSVYFALALIMWLEYGKHTSRSGDRRE